MVMKLLRPREETEDKLTSIGYGFFIPIFFIMTGANMNLRAMFKDPASLALIPVLLVGFFAAKALLLPLLLTRFRKHNALAGTLLTSTTITLVIPALSVGKSLGIISSTQSAAFTLAAVITCIVSPILFNTFYVAEKDDIKKTRVHIIGANLMTVPIVQQLSKGLYDVQLYTDDPVKFKTYNSEAPVTLLSDVTAPTLQAAEVFDADIIVLAHFDEDKNFAVAELALAAKVPRIIARFDAKNATDARYDELAAQGVEVYNTFETNIAMLRSLIETPSTEDPAGYHGRDFRNCCQQPALCRLGGQEPAIRQRHHHQPDLPRGPLYRPARRHPAASGRSHYFLRRQGANRPDAGRIRKGQLA